MSEPVWIDDRENADWLRRWDDLEITSVPQLLQWLQMRQMTLAHFLTLPVARGALDTLPGLSVAARGPEWEQAFDSQKEKP